MQYISLPMEKHFKSFIMEALLDSKLHVLQIIGLVYYEQTTM